MQKSTLLLALAALVLSPAAPLPSAKASPADGKVRILKFEAAWCGPCRQMKPAFDAVASRNRALADFESIDVDARGDLATLYGVDALPTVIAVKDGRVVGRAVGYRNPRQLQRFVRAHR